MSLAMQDIMGGRSWVDINVNEIQVSEDVCYFCPRQGTGSEETKYINNGI